MSKNTHSVSNFIIVIKAKIIFERKKISKQKGGGNMIISAIFDR